jgi:hypothetical protein
MNIICNNCKKLKAFVLEKANVTDAGIVPPLYLPELEYFALVNCPKITQEGRLMINHPNLIGRNCKL